MDKNQAQKADHDDPKVAREILSSARLFYSVSQDAKERIVNTLRSDLAERHPDLNLSVELRQDGRVKISAAPKDV